MIDKISNKILKSLTNENQSEEEKEILLFGITRIVEDIPKFIGIIIIGIILNIIKEMAIATIIIATYKTFTGGVHAKTNWGCFISSVVFYMLIVYVSKYLVFSGMIKYVVYFLIYLFSVYVIWVYVPADVPEIPKVNLKLREKLKIKSIICLNIIYVISLFIVKDTIIQNLLIYSVFFIDLMTTRTLYKLFKTQYGFETYIPEQLD